MERDIPAVLCINPGKRRINYKRNLIVTQLNQRVVQRHNKNLLFAVGQGGLVNFNRQQNRGRPSRLAVRYDSINVLRPSQPLEFGHAGLSDYIAHLT